jgi:hypothetical protein
MGIDWQQSEFPTRGFPTVGENDPDTPLRSTQRPAAADIRIRRKAIRHHHGEEIPEIPRPRNVELALNAQFTLHDKLIKFRERFVKLRVETPRSLV